MPSEQGKLKIMRAMNQKQKAELDIKQALIDYKKEQEERIPPPASPWPTMQRVAAPQAPMAQSMPQGAPLPY